LAACAAAWLHGLVRSKKTYSGFTRDRNKNFAVALVHAAQNIERKTE